MRIVLKVVSLVGAAALGIFLGEAVQSETQPQSKARTSSGMYAVDFPGVNEAVPLTSPTRGYLLVKARASLSNPTVAENLYWFLLVRNPSNGAILYQARSHHRTFLLRAGTSMYPTFSEKILFLPGFYKVTVGLKTTRPVRLRDGSLSDVKSTVCSSTLFEYVE